MFKSTKSKMEALMHSYMLTHKLNPKKWQWCTVTFDEGAELGWRTVFIHLYPSEQLAERDAARYNSTRIHNECGYACALTVKALDSLGDRMWSGMDIELKH